MKLWHWLVDQFDKMLGLDRYKKGLEETGSEVLAEIAVKDPKRYAIILNRLNYSLEHPGVTVEELDQLFPRKVM
jgi:hypothetical protein